MRKWQILLISTLLFLMLTACFNEEEVVSSISDVVLNGVVIKDGYFTDTRDGNKYKIIEVQGDFWFAENLRYSDSVAMPELKKNIWCYDNKADSCKVYGPLYSFDVAQEVCPDGWTIPSASQWSNLESNVSILNMYGYIEKNGTSLKSIKRWVEEDSIPQGTNRIGFNALPGGRRSVEGGFLPTGKYAFFWGTTAIDRETAYGWTLSYNKDVFEKGEFYKQHGMSVRCVSTNYFDGRYVQFTLDGLLDESFVKEIPSTTTELDYMGQKYSTMQLNGVTVMTENLNFETGNSWCYNNESDLCKVYGRLYDYETAQKACPEGWSLLSFEMLKDIGSRADDADLRAVGYWYNESANDMWGLGIMPSGGYEIDTKSFFDLRYSSYLWVQDSLGETCETSMRFYVSEAFSACVPQTTYAQRAYSVRCQKD
ncbi:MAG: hypothetical protein MJY99_09925 [Fibrobacter sp.]|nr:hypothetical protein [Fibrobacter sp.]